MLAMTLLNLNNKYRVVLTEVLPYETPLMFDNDMFYQNINDEKKLEIFYNHFNIVRCHRKSQWYIPFNYNVRKYGGSHSRLLSVIHPLNQLEISSFYEKYANYMLYLCGRSPFSIRHISRVSECIFEKTDDSSRKTALNSNNDEFDLELNSDDENDLELDSVSEDESSLIHEKYSSFFAYVKYDRLYKFFYGVDHVRLEQKYKYCMKLDLSRCFYHIYTHSIAWAVKGKEFAKDHQKTRSLERDFDYLMQRCNYNETNGIVVGPEISRIFAEIILQRIDLDILNELKKKGFVLGKDYDVRRYVDDYFIFANDEKKFEVIKKVCENKCQPFKLYLNEKKIQITKRPFATDITAAKKEVKMLVEELNEKYFSINEDGSYKRKFSDSSWGLTDFVRKYSSIAHQNNVNYSETNRYCLFLIRNVIKRELKRDVKPSEGQLLSIIEISFYLFSLDMNVSGSVRLCSIIDMLVDWCDKIVDRDIRQNIMDRLYRESKRCLDIYQSTSKDNQTNVEILNLLLALHRKTEFDINANLIRQVFSLQDQEESENVFKKLDYFQICTILYVLGNKDAAIYSSLLEEIKRRFKEKIHPLVYSELTMLYFDILTCPYVDKESKVEIYAIVQKKENTGRKKIANENEVNRIIKMKRWFFDWDKNKNLSSIIRKKEYIPTYQ